jgi:predicted small metal-binding protein
LRFKGWSAYLNGVQVDYEEFKSEVEKACDHVRSKQETEKEFRCRDVGTDCDYVIHAKTDEEIFEKAAEHAKQARHEAPFIS